MTLMQTSPDYDVIVVGAGVAGGVLANVLARDNRKVLCIERALYSSETAALLEPSRIVGELLQPGGYAKLRALGLSEALENIDAQPIYGYGIFLDGRARRIPYLSEQHIPESHSPSKVGRSFHNGRFLKRLRQIALTNPNITLVQGNVIALDKDPSGKVVGVSYRDGDNIVQQTGALTIACDGCSSILRKRASTDHKVDVYSKFHGYILNMTDITFPNHGHVVLADPAPVLFYPISSTEVRCLVDVSSSYTGKIDDYMINTVAPQIPEKFREPFLEAIHEGKGKMMPNRVMPAAIDIVPGAILLGDSFNMRHPLTGGGMTVALSDIFIIRKLLRTVPDLSDASEVSRKLDVFYQERKPMSTTINILANALYALFCANSDPALKDMREACFEYLGRGGRMSHDPMAMLGGLKPQRYLLLAHFFSVAFYGCGKALLPYPTPGRISKAWSIFRASFNIIKPLIDAENLWPISWVPITAL